MDLRHRSLESVQAEGWHLFPALALNDDRGNQQSMVDVISIINDNCDYMPEVRTIRETDGSILWVIRGRTEDDYNTVNRHELVDDIERAVGVLAELDAEAEREYDLEWRDLK